MSKPKADHGSIDNPLRRVLAHRALARTDLKPCPFCRGLAQLRHVCAWGGEPELHFAWCSGCGARTPAVHAEIWDFSLNQYLAQDSAALAAQLWNRRSG